MGKVFTETQYLIVFPCSKEVFVSVESEIV